MTTTRSRAIVRIHFHSAECSDELYEHLLAVVEGITPWVEPLPADWSAYADLTGALRFWDRDVEGLVGVLRLRLLALHGVQSSAGAGPTRSIAAMAAAVTPPGAATSVHDDPSEIAAFLRPQPAAALPGVGPKTARTLSRYGITTVGELADTPPAALQRILGTAHARQVQEVAQGIDERPVVPAAAPKSMSASHRFDHDELDPNQHHRIVLALVEELGGRLRDASEIAQSLTLTVTYADRTQTTRTRTLAEPTAHTPALAGTARQLLAGLGLQRARVRGIGLRAERLHPAEHATHQLTLDDHDDKLHRLEAALDQARARYGPGFAGAASAFRSVTTS
ncbi:DNA polymerase Y family protein [Streptomyces lavenduligriseus]|uniref:Helix-hairpin-helix domain-containing protein n=1 Tax=Streptomyces lavenduligriseus TaxID=67315 RepID=A0ABT0P5L3_9ACTN|nr:helix-hairpin-helix domain-containing protein [Streptomyces lavenduligriseus]MCL3999032.1 helix-hairpin-helix domain-containing protein [Streptomyces lavenduligriseus]